MGRPRISQPPCAQRPTGCGPSCSAEGEPGGEAGGCGARLGQQGSSRKLKEREVPPRCGRCPSLTRPGLRGAVPVQRSQLLRHLAQPRRPGSVRLPALPLHKGPPPTSRAQISREAEKEKAVAASALRCSELGRRRSARWGGGRRVCARGRRLRAPRLAY